MSATIKTAKDKLRQEVRHRLSLMNIEERHIQSNYVAERVILHKKYMTSVRVGIYLSLPDEIQTDTILKHLFSTGKTCFIPRYNAEKMDMIRMKDFEERHTLPKTKWNIPQPLEDDEREEASETGDGGLDIMIVPGRAFTRNGDRLGRGKGYYDAYLARYRKTFEGSLPYIIGVAFIQQIVDALPVTEYDQKMDEVIYDTR